MSAASITGRLPDGPAALVIAHPGHELRVWQWLRLAHPRVFILTDGSGGNQRSRLAATERILDAAGATRGAFFGELSDAAIYEAMLTRDEALLVSLVDRVVADVEREGIRHVVADAAEGYNPTHDLCRLIVNAAVEIVSRRSGAALPNLDYTLTGRPDAGPGPPCPGSIRLELSDEAFREKLADAARYAELMPDVDESLRTHGSGAFRYESLRPVRGGQRGDGLPDAIPGYEACGEARVAAGRYGVVIRRRDHVLPLAEAIWSYATQADR